MKLRPYQRETIDKVLTAWKTGCQNALVTMATGLGKTVVFLALIDEILQTQPDARILVVAHRKELIEQPAERMREFYPRHSDRIGIVMADQNQPERQITIATVQTLQVEPRMAELLSHGPIDYLIYDECHHSSADKNLALIQSLKDTNPNLKHLGVTATPVRSDDNGLPYDREIVHLGIKEGVRDGFLAPPRWLAIQTGISLADVPVYGSGDDRDFSQKGLVDVFETDNCFDLVAETHRKYAAGRKAMAFVSSVAGSYRLAEILNDAGVSAIAADGTTKKADRSQILKDFRSGRYDVLVNCALFTEGLDVPEVSCIHQVRPTKSDGLYVQMVGRGLRILPGKNDCIAEGQLVLTDVGLVPIERVTRSMRVWDGVSFVAHSGAVCRGYQEVITYAGLTATPDHKVWADGGWKQFGECARKGIAIAVTGKDGTAVRETAGYRRHGKSEEWAGLPQNALHDLRERGPLVPWQCAQGNRGVPEMRTSRNDRARTVASPTMVVPPFASSTPTVYESERSQLPTLWRKGNRISFRLFAGNGRMGSGTSWLAEKEGTRPHRQQRALRARESALGDTNAERRQQYEIEGERRVSRLSIATPRCSICRYDITPIPVGRDDIRRDSGTLSQEVMQTKRRVWDILNAGPRHRFTVEGLLVSNCLILDYAPLDARNITMLGDVLGVDAKKEAYVEETEEEGAVIAGFTFDGSVKWLSGNPMELVSRQLDYLNMSPWVWTKPSGQIGPMVLGLGIGDDLVERSLVISEPSAIMTVWLVAKREGERWSKAYAVQTGTFEECSDWAEDYAEQRGNPVLARKAKKWRNGLPSEGQLKFARNLGIWQPGMTKGQCADAITAKLAVDAVRRAGAK